MERFTEEKLKNKKFKNSEVAIKNALFLAKNKFRVGYIIKKAQISRATFYRHHQSINEIIPDYEKYLLKRFKKTVCHPTRDKDIRLRTLYERTLLFMLAHEEIISCVLIQNDSRFIERMILSLEPAITATRQLHNKEIFIIYAREVACIIESWQQSKSKKENLSVTLDKIVYLTNTAHIRLSPLTSFR